MSTPGNPGHVAYVDSVSPDGSSFWVYEENYGGSEYVRYPDGHWDEEPGYPDGPDPTYDQWYTGRLPDGTIFIYGGSSSGTSTPPGSAASPAIAIAPSLVAHAYRLLFARTVDPSGSSTWGTALATGAISSTEFGRALASSPEFASDEVTSYYHRYLGRAPDQSGLTQWVNAIKGGATLEQVRDAILASPEFYSDSGNIPSGYVTALYQKVLGRTPSPSEIAPWVSALNGGASRKHVADAIVLSTEGLSDLVRSWYQQFLQRTPGQSEVSPWVAALRNGTTDQAVIGEFVGSGEFLGRAANRLVTRVYNTLLNRSPDPGGLSTWSNALTSNAHSTHDVMTALANTPEFASDEVTSYYHRYLGRAPDQSGLTQWVNAIKGGATFEQVRDAILASPEFYSDSGNTPSGYVTALYQKVLGRTPSASEMAPWVNALNNGASRNAVANSIVTSPEGLSDLVRSWYQQFLQRTPGQSEVSPWVAALKSSAKDQDVIASILASTEFQIDSQYP